MDNNYLVDIQHERLSFFTPAGEVKALNDVSIHLKEGEVLGIVGESGSGKSVTAYSLMGLTAYPGKLIGGELHFNGHEVEKMTEKDFSKMRGKEVSIIFQDPLTSLNPVYNNGNQIMEVIRELAKTKTILFISHRLANVVASDQIYMLENGQITESGTHGELMKKAGSYANMYQKQQELCQVREGRA